MTIEHNLILDPNRHEPKGITGAAAGTAYVATGGGADTGAWEIILPPGFAGAQNGQAFHKDGGAAAWKYPAGTVYGEMDIINNVVVQNIAYTSATPRATWLSTDANYIKMTGASFPFQSTIADLVTFDAANDQLVVQVAGDYKIDFWGTFFCADANTFLGIKYSVNNTTPYSAQKIIAQSATSNDVILMAAAGIVTSLGIGDNLSLRIAAWRSAGLNTDVTFEDGGMTFTLLHET